MAPAPKAAVPPSVRHACLRFTTKPQIKSEIVKRRESVALQTFRTAFARLLNWSLGWSGASCIPAAMIARGPSRMNMSCASRREGYMRERNCMCVIYKR